MSEVKKKKKKRLYFPNVIKRGDKFYVRVTYTDNGIKKAVHQELTEYDKDLARSIADEIKQTIKDGRAGLYDETDKDKASITFGEFLEKWYKAISPTLSYRTKEDYREIIDLHLKPRVGQVLLGKLTEKNLQAVFDAMHKKHIGRRTHYARTVASMALNYAVRIKYIPSNPCNLTTVEKLPHTEIVVLDREEAKRFIDVCRREPNGIIFEFALVTGMRPEEYLALKWSDIDFESRTAQVRRTIKIDSNPPVFEDVKTKSSQRSVEFTRSLAERLRLLRATQKKHKEKFKEFKKLKYTEFNLVFPSAHGVPYAARNLTRRYFTPILERAEIDKPGFTLYCLRHTCATLLLLMKENAKVVQERLGHSSINITLDTYAFVLPTMQAGATDKFEKLLQ